MTINRHSLPAKGYADNMRLFQATGVGSCLITDAAANMSDLFVDGQEIVTYDSLNDCLEKIRYLLDHEAEREKIAKAGQKRTLKCHTTFHRCLQIHEILQAF